MNFILAWPLTLFPLDESRLRSKTKVNFSPGCEHFEQSSHLLSPGPTTSARAGVASKRHMRMYADVRIFFISISFEFQNCVTKGCAQFGAARPSWFNSRAAYVRRRAIQHSTRNRGVTRSVAVTGL